MYKLTIALPKGRLAGQAIELLLKCGIEFAENTDDRKLIKYDSSKEFRFLFVKPVDVPVYVERGIADLGIAGKDTIMEQNKDIYELLNLNLGKCKLCIAGPVINIDNNEHKIRVATKYPNIATKFYSEKYITADIIELNGSVELAPISNLSDVILDIVESGQTLKSNGLKIIEEVADISARLIANKVSYKTKFDIINPIKNALNEEAAKL